MWNIVEWTFKTSGKIRHVTNGESSIHLNPTGRWNRQGLLIFDFVHIAYSPTGHAKHEMTYWDQLVQSSHNLKMMWDLHWLVVWLPFFIFPYIGNNHPNWLIFFRGVQITNQSSNVHPRSHPDLRHGDENPKASTAIQTKRRRYQLPIKPSRVSLGLTLILYSVAKTHQSLNQFLQWLLNPGSLWVAFHGRSSCSSLLKLP